MLLKHGDQCRSHLSVTIHQQHQCPFQDWNRYRLGFHAYKKCLALVVQNVFCLLGHHICERCHYIRRENCDKMFSSSQPYPEMAIPRKFFVGTHNCAISSTFALNSCTWPWLMTRLRNTTCALLFHILQDLQFGDKTLRQEVCIAMDTNCSPFLTDLFVYACESEFLLGKA